MPGRGRGCPRRPHRPVRERFAHTVPQYLPCSRCPGPFPVRAHDSLLPSHAIRANFVDTRGRARCVACPSLARRSCPARPSRCLAAVIVGPLGLGSPRVQFRFVSVPVPAVLCLAATPFVRPGRFASGSLPVPWSDPLSFVFLRTRVRVGSRSVRVCRFHAGVLVMPLTLLAALSLPRRREGLPSSRITPLNTCPALRPRCPVRLP